MMDVLFQTWIRVPRAVRPIEAAFLESIFRALEEAEKQR